jgi:hypothetical protein
MTKGRILVNERKPQLNQSGNRKGIKHHVNGSLDETPLYILQQQIGNRAVQRLMSNQIQNQPAGSFNTGDFFQINHSEVDDTSKPGITRDNTATKESVEDISDLQDVFHSLENPGHSLDEKILEIAKTSFGTGISDVKIHDDEEALELTSALHTQAMASERDIYFNRGVYQPGTDTGNQVISHELTHITEGQTGGKVAFWGGSDHEKLTQQSATQVMPEEGFLINSLKFRSTMMDLRPRRFTKNVIVQGAKSKTKTFIRKRVGSIPGLEKLARKIHIPKVAPEGSEHGEGGMYDPNIKESEAIKINEDEQKKHINRAVEYKRKFNLTLKQPGKTTLDKLGQLADVNKQIAVELGDALHIAQDRGSHAEGIYKRGHDDPRPLEEFECDESSKNPGGFTAAFKNSINVLKEYWSRRDEK